MLFSGGISLSTSQLLVDRNVKKLRTGCCFQVVFHFLLLSSWRKWSVKKLRTGRCFQMVFCRKGVSKAKDGMLFSSWYFAVYFSIVGEKGVSKS